MIGWPLREAASLVPRQSIMALPSAESRTPLTEIPCFMPCPLLPGLGFFIILDTNRVLRSIVKDCIVIAIIQSAHPYAEATTSTVVLYDLESPCSYESVWGNCLDIRRRCNVSLIKCNVSDGKSNKVLFHSDVPSSPPLTTDH
jgi:hypothetical protein